MNIYKLTIFDNDEKSLEISSIRKIFNIIIPQRMLCGKKIFFSHELNKVHNIDGNKIILFTDLNMIDKFVNRNLVNQYER